MLAYGKIFLVIREVIWDKRRQSCLIHCATAGPTYSFRPQCGPGDDSTPNRGMEIWEPQFLGTNEGLSRNIEGLQGFQVLFSDQGNNC
jgi:hypothetical protein